MKKWFLCLLTLLLVLAGLSALAEETPAIPVVSLDGDCLIDYTNWNDKKTYYPATLTYTDGDNTFTKDIEIKPQGTTSLYAPKKNFTIKFSEAVEMAPGWGVQKKYVLKADYIDPTHSGNVVSAKLAAEMNQQYGLLGNAPNYGLIDGFPIWVKINGEDAGLFNWTIPKDAWLFGMDEENPNHLVLACEGWSDASRMISSEIDYEVDWAFEVGEATDENKAAFERLVQFISAADDQTFVADFDQYLNLDACLNYLCFLNIAYGSDNVAKNMLMVTYDGKVWYPTLYDLDSLWGIGYDGTAVAVPDGQWPAELITNGNCLLYRVNYLFADQVRERYQELREGILSKEYVMAAFEDYTARISQEYYDIDQALWNADGARIRTLELMGQLMDEYLPIVDAAIMSSPSADQNAAIDGPEIHYVWEINGVQHSSQDISTLPASMTLSYTLDGNAITAEELAGKSGRLEATLRVERNADAERAYGVTALLDVDEAQCENMTVTGGTCKTVSSDYVCLGTAWLGGTHNIYEMQLSADVTAFDPAAYTVVLTPVHFNGGNDGTLNALLAVAGEMQAIIDEGIILHTSMTEMHQMLTNMQHSLAEAGTSLQKLLPAADATETEDAASIMQTLLADAELAADTMLTGFGREVAAEVTTADRMQMLAEIADAAERTEEEKAQAFAQLDLIENYLVVVDQLEKTQKVAGEINDSLTLINDNLPELAGAYAYSNDQLYAIVYQISMLYQNLANYYHANFGIGGGYDFTQMGDWYDVIIFSNAK